MTATAALLVGPATGVHPAWHATPVPEICPRNSNRAYMCPRTPFLGCPGRRPRGRSHRLPSPSLDLVPASQLLPPSRARSLYAYPPVLNPTATPATHLLLATVGPHPLRPRLLPPPLRAPPLLAPSPHPRPGR